MRHLIAALALLAATAHADTGIDAVAVISHDLGYELAGAGVQLDIDGRAGAWGWDAQATVVDHSKRGAVGRRYQAVGMGRRHFEGWFIEAGLEWGGYSSRFQDGREWTKYGFAPGIGVGVTSDEHELTLRYFTPDSTPNETSVIAVSAEFALTGPWVAGATAERWLFDQGGERLSGTQFTLEVGYRF